MVAKQLRPYQSRIVDDIGHANAIVKMPTGSGKTIVAAELVARHLSRDTQRLAIFLVPTKELVDQQARVVEQWCSQAKVSRYMGGMAPPSVECGRVCLVSTPQAFLILQTQEPSSFGWHRIGIIIFDEVHHLLKDHPYRHISLSLTHSDVLEKNSNNPIQILGLSASLTYDIHENAIKNTLNRICRDLHVTMMVSPSLQELKDGGYVPPYGDNTILERSSETPEGVVPARDRKPHLMHDTFMRRIRNGSATAFSKKVWAVLKVLEQEAKMEHPGFLSPLKQVRLSSWEEYAHELARKKRLQPTFRLLEVWYVALRVLVQTWEEEELLVMQWLKMENALSGVSCPEADGIRRLIEQPENFYKFGRLRFHLQSQKKDKFRCIVFVQQRLTAAVLAHFINSDPELQASGLKAGFVASRGSKITPSYKITNSLTQSTIDAFRSNKLNVLVATSVIEEGFDVPEANVVISYDHMKDSVELCQRSGRAREQDSSIVILDERPDRPLTVLESARTLQDTITEAYEPSHSAVDQKAEEEKERQRERSARKGVLQDHKKCTNIPVQALNEYAKKTKALVLENYSVDWGEFTCKLTYRSHLRRFEVEGRGASKKAAKKEASQTMLEMLRQNCG
eukprot:Nitzschia sp. Nitz4//scaffold159_size51929//3928//5796//NITZ4_006871-RA/size51929-processed-gene-0.49-mRNA-1//-1//CDS//3329537550//3026//frame0